MSVRPFVRLAFPPDDGVLHLGGEEVALDNLASKVRATQEQVGEDGLRVCPDVGAPYAPVVAAVKVQQDEGLVKVGVIQ